MQVYKTFAKIAKKKFSNTITYFVVFFVLLIAFSFQVHIQHLRCPMSAHR